MANNNDDYERERSDNSVRNRRSTMSTYRKRPQSSMSDDINRAKRKRNNNYDSRKSSYSHYNYISDDIDPESVFKLRDIKKQSMEALAALAQSLEIHKPEAMFKQDLIFAILEKILEQKGVIMADGILELSQENGGGFLRLEEENYGANTYAIYVHPKLISSNGLRSGDYITGPILPPQRANEQYFSLISVLEVNGFMPSNLKNRVHFDSLTPLFPNERLFLESNDPTAKSLSARVIDLVAPIGKGQRQLIVAPPRTGKTILMQNIAHAITANYPDIVLIVLLIGERPEEVTDMTRSVKGQVFSSTFDEPSQRHVDLSELVIERAKRLVEQKKDVVILLDSITRLARAYNDVVRSSGKVLSGGVDSNALQRPKRFFGAARNIEEGGSLTIIATALVETGSKMDEVIFEEFKGTGNSEIVLERRISDKRTYPAVDIAKSGTRKEDLLVARPILSKVWVLRKILSPMSSVEAIDFLLEKLKLTRSNEEFFEQMNAYGNGANINN